ncbi:glycosyltransferase family 4 protein [Paraburkholderia sp. CNPSo 3076]|uniref:MraY family glycosyltransferase n=1 Tax=Paraburkholderia sp. CNPSo 3076 TaxID=2940936 RepID=UPI00224CD2A1|nr:glycosyltransferase family 4 protein [Paraburkholderia sp. CNPSo 3076]MCX5543195.1 glycosyltransferase family 4 protein [Paraburkholderia sp. CNPSo 3076]
MPLTNLDVLYSALFAFCLCALALWGLLKTGIAWRLATDVPNDRSLHVVPIPRAGGWGIVPVVAVLMMFESPSLWLIAFAFAVLAAVSQIDDRRGLPVSVRFGAHVFAVAALVALYPAQVPWPALAVIAFLMTWLVNLYNFMDGSDGLAGGMALFGFGGYAIAALTAARPDLQLAVASALAAGAAGGFLLFNFHPARIFLGDAGSIPLGFLAGALGYWGWRGGAWPIWFPALIFSPFIADASVTLARRLLRGEKVWQAHREHYYQRMVQMGYGHALTARIWYSFMAAGIMLAIAARTLAPVQQWLAVVTWATLLGAAGMYVDRRWRRHQSRLVQT